MTSRIVKILSLFVVLLIPASACYRRVATDIPTADPIAQISPEAININTASADELQRIPHIGESLAGKIIEHREKHGPFRKAEHLMLIQGISDKRFRKIRPLVRVE